MRTTEKEARQEEPVALDFSRGTSTEASVWEYDWVDEAVVSIAKACNLCDVYKFQQVEYERTQEKEEIKFGSNMIQGLEVELYRKFLFDESSIRLDFEEEEPDHVHGASSGRSCSGDASRNEEDSV